MDGVTKWEDEAIVNRTNVCDRQRRFSNGELQLRDTLSVFIADFASIDSAKALFELSEDGTIPLKPGIVAVLLDELARRAGFTWRNRFVSDIIDENDKQNNKTCTCTDLLVWSTKNFDISAAFFNASNQRRALGINFPAFWYHDSMILISLKKPKIDYGLHKTF